VVKVLLPFVVDFVAMCAYRYLPIDGILRAEAVAIVVTHSACAIVNASYTSTVSVKGVDRHCGGEAHWRLGARSIASEEDVRQPSRYRNLHTCASL